VALDDIEVVLLQSAPRRSAATPAKVGAWAALLCSVVGLPWCVWLLAYYLSQFGPDWVFQLVTQASNDPLRRAIDHGSAVGLILALLGLIAGGLISWRNRRRGALSRVAHWALGIGVLGVSMFAIGVLSMLIAFAMWEGPA
jgi:hypothetical protein